ncbi:MAG TPA: hypothetical protein VMT74_10835 [Gaiellaceae bacterium]|nr:hypothetical protein [Gaiellaceae bacterium]
MRRTLAWIAPVAAAAAVAPLARGNGGDASIFVPAGRTLLSSHWSLAFAQPHVQVGSFQLALFGSVGRSSVALAVLLGAAAALLVVAAARAAGVERPRWLAAAGLVAVVTGFTRAGWDTGHPADSLLPLLWVLAAADARRGRVLRAGLVVGLSSGFETWGILGVAVLALAPRARDAARGAAVSAGVAAALYLPFVAAGHFEMGRYRWLVSSHSLLALFVATGTEFGWPLRIAQGAIALAAGLAVGRAVRGSRHAVWLVPGAIVAARLLLDPHLNDYYFTAIEAPALVALALVGAGGLPLRGRRLAGEPLA